MTIEKLFSLWASVSDMAADVGETVWAVAKWKQRKRIPQHSWPAVIDAANRKGKRISADDLLAMHAHRSKAPVETAACK